ncbi:G-type lectin S-receptor-like serine/threonine-protein kinase At4g27290 isoform X2 [Rhodamnia argentea]|uniref:Receptor-like serine/threonine-protein kinase n=1 Tax=Rhodamnia argentea TaxID=178133 RepID=A0A8B8MU81_9MYRT|nr:G-type lectin S-receptor-like serine/threonine-protein kinase At4g27290 isoform X2 [Rhodamnia argentea]
MDALYLLLFFSINTLRHLPGLCAAADTITPSRSLSDVNGSTLSSQDGTFELGFFSPGNSQKRFVGIWYKNVPARTVVWVANRLNPINDSSGVLMIDGLGKLVILSSNSAVVWSANSSGTAQDPVVQLLDTGNLVLRNGDDGDSGATYLWQSFDYPTDTVIAEMKIGWDLRRGIDRRLTAWKSADDPSPGDFSWGLELHNYPEAVAWKGNQEYFRSGPWNGLRYSGAPEQRTNPLFSFNFVNNEDEVYFIFHLKNKSVLTRSILNQSNYAWERYTWSEATQAWKLSTTVPKDYCDYYGLCGAYSNCDVTELPVCQCLSGFSPKSPEKWNSMDWSEGCTRNKPLECGDRDGFVEFGGLKLPDTKFSWVNRTLDLKECRAKCLRNCSCMAYTHSDISGAGSGCVMWFGDLVDIRHFADGGQHLYIRMPRSALGLKSRHWLKIVVIVVAVTLAASVLLLTCYNIRRWRKKLKEVKIDEEKKEPKNESSEEDLELPTFDLSTISDATDNFSLNQKIGEGGFGPVYKGMLPDGQQIAVKRLSTISRQGTKEFKNEVILIAKLQHRNLVKLLGCCIEGEEKVLIYEYMPNRSLDAFIFDGTRGKLLDWQTRFNIICGVARGLLYLHQDSRLRIIHRDLKASNVLLDNEMNPKISDFGMARTFGGDQSEGNTNRVVGTYGYMAPEYAIDGLFSVKSDVFSFGILILEIISGKRNRGLFHSNQNLIGHAWRLYAEGRPLDLIDPCLDRSCILSEVLRCIHLSFLCLQHHPEDRPSMASVVVMLGSESALPPPKQPGFLIDRNPFEGDSSSSKHELNSVNEITVTLVEAR